MSAQSVMLASLMAVSMVSLVSLTRGCPGECTSCDNWGNNDAGWGCDAGYWGFGEGYECLSCEDIGCGAESGGVCADFKGCEICPDGEAPPEANIYFCGNNNYKFCGSSDVGGSTNPETDTDTDTNTDTEDDEDPSTITTTAAIAVFADTGIYGSVVVTNGHVMVYLNFTRFDFDQLNSIGGKECVTQGLYYGIYDDWNHDEFDSYVGEEDCSVNEVGHRMDPWLACSELSNNEFCKNSPKATDDTGCVPSQSYLEKDDDNIYTCSKYTFAYSPYSCEVGDMSGKYGKLEYDAETKSILAIHSSPFEFDSYDLGGSSVVFRCGTTKARVFCAGFEELDLTQTSLTTAEYLHPSFALGSEGNGDWNYYRPHQTTSHSKIARFNEKSFIKLGYKHDYVINIDVSSLTIPGSCGPKLIYRVFDSDECEEDGGIDDEASFYDPTVTCNEGSEWDGWLCDDTERCNYPFYVYTCETDGYYRNQDRFACGPADLSNKYGSIEIGDSTNVVKNSTGYDALMTSLSELDGMSVVIQCEETGRVIACGVLEDMNDNEDLIESESDSEDDDNQTKKERAADDDNALGVSDTVAIVVIVLLIGIVVPCVRSICKRRKEGQDNGDQSVAAMFGFSGFGKKAGGKTAADSEFAGKQRRASTASRGSSGTNKARRPSRATSNMSGSTGRSGSRRPEFVRTPSTSAGAMGTGAAMGAAAGVAGAAGAAAAARRQPSRASNRERSVSRSYSSRGGSRPGSRAGSRPGSRPGSRAGSARPPRAGAMGAAGAAAAAGGNRSRTHSREPSRSRSMSRSRSEHGRTQSSPNRGPVGPRRNGPAGQMAHQRVGTDSLTQAGANALGLNGPGPKRGLAGNLPVIPSGYTGPRPGPNGPNQGGPSSQNTSRRQSSVSTNRALRRQSNASTNMSSPNGGY